MSILTKLKSSYTKWQSEADQRAEKAIKKAETQNERDKIRNRLAIEKAERKKVLAKAQTEQKEAEAARKQADRKLKGSSNSFSWLESLANLGSNSSSKSKPKSKTATRKVTRKPTPKRKVAKKKTTHRKSSGKTIHISYS